MLLVVEDERLIRDCLEDELTDAAFEVVTAADGNQAIAELDKGAARFRAVITDIRLGTGPDGWNVGRHARQLVPAMGIIYVTGDSGHDWPSMGVPGSVLLSKPYIMAQLITALSKLLNEADARRALGGGDC